MPTTLSIETQLKDGLKLRGVSTEEFARVAKLEGISNSSRATLNKAFQDESAIPLRNDVALRLLALWSEIEEMVFEFLPFPLDVTNGERTHASLQIFRGLNALKGKQDQ